MKPINQNKSISLIVPIYNEESNIRSLHGALTNISTKLKTLEINTEIIYINDGSKDDSIRILKEISDSQANCITIDFTRNFGKEAALTAGIDICTGDAAIPIDADLQDPPELILQMATLWLEGYDVVNAVRTKRDGETFLKKSTAHLFYRLFNSLSKIKIPPDTGDFRLISRQVIESLKMMPERNRFMKGLFAWTSFNTINLEFNRHERSSGQSGFNYKKLIDFAIDGITSFSTSPLRLSTYVGLVIAFTSFIYAAHMIVDTILFGNPVKGYPSLMVIILFLGGIQLIALGIIGEYLARVYEEVKQRPIYLIRQIYKK